MKKTSLFFAAVAVSLLPVAACADNVKFDNPLIDGYGLDHCREWRENCGMPAAQAFCQSKGYAGAADFQVVSGNQKTRVINGGQVCDGANCSRITQIICQTEEVDTKVDPEVETQEAPRTATAVQPLERPEAKSYYDPQVGDRGLDYCREAGRHCGLPAAHAFCQSKGYKEAIDFTVHKGNRQKTRTIYGGKTCDASVCDRITKVTCR